MDEPISLLVCAPDPLSRAGIGAELSGFRDLRIAATEDPGAATVATVVVDEVDDEAIRLIRALRRNGCPRVLVVASRMDDHGLLAAVEAGACGLLRRSEASPTRLVTAIRAAAAGEGTVPPDLLGRLLAQIGRLQQQVLAPRGLSFAGLSDREIAVLKLVAEGLATNEIARQLCYSERTIKNVIHDITKRLNLRNRSQAVAWAMKAGMI
jgi:DNA-binding NarL/FixJ family response regulator